MAAGILVTVAVAVRRVAEVASSTSASPDVTARLVRAGMLGSDLPLPERLAELDALVADRRITPEEHAAARSVALRG